MQSTTAENVYVGLTVVCGLMLGVGGVLLFAPMVAPAPIVEFMRSLPAMWVLPTLLLTVGGTLGMLLLMRSAATGM